MIRNQSLSLSWFCFLAMQSISLGRQAEPNSSLCFLNCRFELHDDDDLNTLLPCFLLSLWTSEPWWHWAGAHHHVFFCIICASRATTMTSFGSLLSWYLFCLLLQIPPPWRRVWTWASSLHVFAKRKQRSHYHGFFFQGYKGHGHGFFFFNGCLHIHHHHHSNRHGFFSIIGKWPWVFLFLYC